MAELKRRTIIFSSGKQIRLFGNSVGISKTLEIGEGYNPNILGSNYEENEGDAPALVNNPHKLSQEEIMELADYMMQLWLQLKENIRKNGITSPKIFIREGLK